MKVNYLGIFAGIIALSSLLWPWWTLDLTYRTQALEVIGEEVSVYPYQIATTAFILLPDTVLMNLWFGWATLVLIVAGGIVGFWGGLTSGRRGRMILLASGILCLLSLVAFTVGIYSELSNVPPSVGFPVTAFPNASSITADVTGYSYFFDFGFWIALIAVVVAFVSVFMPELTAFFKREETKPTGV